MMPVRDKSYKMFIAILAKELQVAYGCTEPASVAYASALASSHLPIRPEWISISCNSNIVKNVKSVVIPFTNGRRGIQAAAAAGIVAKDYSMKLGILSVLGAGDTDKILDVLSSTAITVDVVESPLSFFLDIVMGAGEETAEVRIENGHTNVTLIRKGSEVLYSSAINEEESDIDYGVMNARSIYDFASSADIADVKEILDRQIADNMAIAETGIAGGYGAEVGASLYSSSHSIEDRVTAFAAAGSDARMAGCKLPVIINSGSGNQGITVSVPLITYAIYQRHGIGCLSAYCGAVNAGVSAVCGIEFMDGYPFDVICHTLEAGLATASGIVCDGAKSSCASKIAVALKAGWLGRDMAVRNKWFEDGEGIVKADADSTISAVVRLGGHGMKEVDREIVSIMLG